MIRTAILIVLSLVLMTNQASARFLRGHGMSSCGLSTLNAASPRESCQTDIMKVDKLRKGMTYEQVLQILGCEPAESETITYGNRVVAKLYRWQAGKDQISASFRDGRLSEIGGVIND